MRTTRHYPKAPITEAVIDLRVLPSSALSVGDLAKVREEEGAAYPTMHELNTMQGQMLFGTEVSASAHKEHVGFLFRSSDGTKIHQAHVNGFSMSQLAPYPHWDEFRSEARRRWNIYCSVAKPAKIVRAGVRYINRIDIPLPLNDFGDYLQTGPHLSPHLPQGLSNYFMQLEIPLENIKSLATINETIIQPAKPDVVSIVLDIDIFRTDELPDSDDGVWAFIEQLREVKNDLFEACITDKARELFQ